MLLKLFYQLAQLLDDLPSKNYKQLRRIDKAVSFTGAAVFSVLLNSERKAKQSWTAIAPTVFGALPPLIK